MVLGTMQVFNKHKHEEPVHEVILKKKKKVKIPSSILHSTSSKEKQRYGVGMWPGWLTAQLLQNPECGPQHHLKTGTSVHGYNASTQEVKAGEAEVEGSSLATQ